MALFDSVVQTSEFRVGRLQRLRPLFSVLAAVLVLFAISAIEVAQILATDKLPDVVYKINEFHLVTLKVPTLPEVTVRKPSQPQTPKRGDDGPTINPQPIPTGPPKGIPTDNPEPTPPTGPDRGPGRGNPGPTDGPDFGPSPQPPAPKTPEPQKPLIVGGDIKPPMKTKHVAPIYPAIAQASRTQGVVIIEATIGIDGRVQNARILRSIALLDAAALDAVRQWVFTPTLLNGVPQTIIMTVTVNFSLQ